jgi:hypothetical protein
MLAGPDFTRQSKLLAAFIKDRAQHPIASPGYLATKSTSPDWYRLDVNPMYAPTDLDLANRSALLTGGDKAPDRILHVHSRFDRNLSRSQQRSPFLGNPAFNLDAFIETCTSGLRQHGGIILLGFAVHLTQCGMRPACIDADHRRAALAKFTIQPVRHPARFQSDTPDVLQVIDQGTLYHVGVGRLLECRLDNSALRANAKRRLVLRQSRPTKSCSMLLSYFNSAIMSAGER